LPEVGNTRWPHCFALAIRKLILRLATAQAYQGVTTMRELTHRELDAVGGGLSAGFQLGLLSQQIQQTQNSSAIVGQGGFFTVGSPNTATVTQVNIALGSIV
jgi:hypothetical protein